MCVPAAPASGRAAFGPLRSRPRRGIVLAMTVETSERPAAGVAGLILAGGRARRMGGIDKPFAELAGRPLIAHVIDRVRPQVAALALNAAHGAAGLDAFGPPILADADADGRIEPLAGPLAGLLAGLDWALGEAAIR